MSIDFSTNSDTPQNLGKTDVERKLDYCVLPKPELQQKIDKFISPYNQSKSISKFMSFENPLSLDSGLKDLDPKTKKWKKLAYMIINEDETKFRKSLIDINNKLYLELEKELKNKLKDRNTVIPNRTRSRFASGENLEDSKFITYDHLQSLMENYLKKQRVLIRRKSSFKVISKLTKKLEENNEENNSTQAKIRKALMGIRDKKIKLLRDSQVSKNNSKTERDVIKEAKILLKESQLDRDISRNLPQKRKNAISISPKSSETKLSKPILFNFLPIRNPKSPQRIDSQEPKKVEKLFVKFKRSTPRLPKSPIQKPIPKMFKMIPPVSPRVCKSPPLLPPSVRKPLRCLSPCEYLLTERPRQKVPAFNRKTNNLLLF